MISTFSWICICFCLIVIKYVFIRPSDDKKLYMLYEARDNVALAAVEGKISQDAEEYKFVIETINNALYYMKNNYDFSILVNNIVFQPEKAEQYFSNMVKLIQGYDFLEKNYNISTAYFKKSINVRLFFFMYLVIYPFYFSLRLLLVLLTLGKKMTDFSLGVTYSAERRIDTIIKIDNIYGTYRKSYAK